MAFLLTLSPAASLSSAALAGEKPPAFTRPDLSITTDGDHLSLVGNLHISLSKTAAEALDNGLPLTLITEISLIDPQKWLWNKKIWAQQYRHQIHYHALGDQYLVKSAESRYPKAFYSRQTAIEALGNMEHIELATLALLESTPYFELRVHTRLDIQSLPTPLRPLAFLSTEWKLQNEWKAWQTR